MDDTTSPVLENPPPMPFEETPVITPIEDEQKTQEATPSPVLENPPKKKSVIPFIRNMFLLGVLFVVGYMLSGYVRDAINTSQLGKVSAKPTPTGKPVLKELESTTAAMVTSGTPTATKADVVWKQYSPLNGTTRAAIDMIQFKLPDSVLPLVCDGSACGSQGTYLPGGTRFTVAPRGTGQVLADFRGKIISDAGGKAFVTKQTTIAGKPATEFSTDTLGSTIGGYAFSTMHGFMIEVTDTLSLEINHFSPSGINADFSADDALFNQIITTLTFSGVGTTTTKGAIISPAPTATITTTPTPELLTPIR